MNHIDIRLSFIESFRKTRALSCALCEPLEVEDYVIQSMPDASPPKWHLAHTTWFFETFVLARHKNQFTPFHPRFHELFNSYYDSLGSYGKRNSRGLLSRPTLCEVHRYRESVDNDVCELLRLASKKTLEEILPTITLGLQHEEQHQELLVTDIKHALFSNPLQPAFIKNQIESIVSPSTTMAWLPFKSGLYTIGASNDFFAFDNERPQHKVYIHDFALASRLVTNGEFIEFIEDKGYLRPELWLSLGWNYIRQEKIDAPLYWHNDGKQWFSFTLSGVKSIQPFAPVSHISFYEADAYARWRRARLPTESEWEVAALTLPASALLEQNDLSTGALRPMPASSTGLTQMFGCAWEWTSSAYLPYPGFTPLSGPESEYNGKFMSNQMILRGGSCATPRGHIRASYRNFFPPETRWQFSGIRLAKDGGMP